MDHESGTGTAGRNRLEDEATGEPEAAMEQAATEVPRAVAELPNPFWSDRATDEFILRQARPLELAEYDDRQIEPDYAASEEKSAPWKFLRGELRLGCLRCLQGQGALLEKITFR